MSKKEPLKIGDRVRVFTGREAFNGKVNAIADNGALFVIEDGFYSSHNDAPFHPRQCVRLRKKPSPPAKGEGGTEPVKTSPEGLHAFVVATAKEIRMLAMRRIGERAEHKEAQTWLLYGRIVSVLFAWHFKPSYEYAERRLGLEGGAK